MVRSLWSIRSILGLLTKAGGWVVYFAPMVRFTPPSLIVYAYTYRIHIRYTMYTSTKHYRRTYFHDNFPKVHANYPLQRQIYHRFKQNVLESESRQFGRLRLRLGLLASCHDSGRLRLRLRSRTPGSDNWSVSRLGMRKALTCPMDYISHKGNIVVTQGTS